VIKAPRKKKNQINCSFVSGCGPFYGGVKTDSFAGEKEQNSSPRSVVKPTRQKQIRGKREKRARRRSHKKEKIRRRVR